MPGFRSARSLGVGLSRSVLSAVSCDETGVAGLSRPEFAWAGPGGTAKVGSCVCLRCCCLIDLTLGSCEQYVLAFSAFLNGMLDRSSDERLTVLVGNRPAEGAPNLPGIKSSCRALGQQMSRTLSDHDQCAPPARNRA